MSQVISQPSQIKNISDREFNQIRALLFDKTGITLSDGKKPLVSGRLAKRLRHFGFKKFGDYYQQLESEKFVGEEMQEFLNLLTTNETHFFRESAHFDFLQNNILSQQASLGKFRMWSAASSSGEEAYSAAMIIASQLREKQWEILGTDINSTVLQTAKRGIYPMSVVGEIPSTFLKKYCLRGIGSQSGSFIIDRQLKKHIEFKQLNLNQHLPDIGKFDLIMLRNVMIYFTNDTKQTIVQQMLPKLKKGGYFIVGHSENLSFLKSQLTLVQPSVYIKN